MSKNSEHPEHPERIRKTSRALPIALLRARESVMAPIRVMLADINLTEQKWRVLRTLDECGGLEQTAIAKEACLLLPSLTRILRSMETDGLIKRDMDAADKRRMMVSITPAGREILTSNMQVSQDIYASIERQLGRRKMEQLLDLLEELQDIKTIE